jgi:spermidine/putrescine transport system substrate-binding protein
MDVIGYVSCIGGEEILEAMSDPESFEPEDASYFFGPEATAVPLNPVMYPSTQIVERCGIMHDSGERTEDLFAMWSRVKGDNAGMITYIIIAVALVAVVAIVLVSRGKKKHTRKRR